MYIDFKGESSLFCNKKEWNSKNVCICLKMTVIQVHSDIYWHGVFSMHFGALSLDLTNLLFLIFTLYSYVLKIALMLCQNKCQNSKKKT